MLPDEPELIEDSYEIPTEEIVLENTTPQEPVRDFILVENEPEETEVLQAIIEEPKREPPDGKRLIFPKLRKKPCKGWQAERVGCGGRKKKPNRLSARVERPMTFQLA